MSIVCDRDNCQKKGGARIDYVPGPMLAALQDYLGTLGKSWGPDTNGDRN